MLQERRMTPVGISGLSFWRSIISMSRGRRRLYEMPWRMRMELGKLSVALSERIKLMTER